MLVDRALEPSLIHGILPLGEVCPERFLAFSPEIVIAQLSVVGYPPEGVAQRDIAPVVPHAAPSGVGPCVERESLQVGLGLYHNHGVRPAAVLSPRGGVEFERFHVGRVEITDLIEALYLPPVQVDEVASPVHHPHPLVPAGHKARQLAEEVGDVCLSRERSPFHRELYQPRLHHPQLWAHALHRGLPYLHIHG